MSVFVAWMPGEDARSVLAPLVAGLADNVPAGAPRHRWRQPGQWHLTLRYLGRWDAVPAIRLEALRPRLAQICAHASPIALHPERAEYWPRSRVLMLRPAPSRQLDALSADIDREVDASGFGHADAPWTPHITLAYLDTAWQPTTLPMLSPAGPVTLDSASLIENRGRSYQPLACWPLANTID